MTNCQLDIHSRRAELGGLALQVLCNGVYHKMFLFLTHLDLLPIPKENVQIKLFINEYLKKKPFLLNLTISVIFKT